MARPFFGSITWISWQKTLYGVLFELQSALSKGFFCNDGDHQAKESNATNEDKEGLMNVKEVKEIHTIVRNALSRNHILMSSSIENRPGFVHLLQ